MQRMIDPASRGAGPWSIESETAARLFRWRAARHPERVALREFGIRDSREPVTWGEWLASSEAVAAALVAQGSVPGERVAVLAGNRPLWPIVDLGVAMAGGVTVGLYPTSAASQVRQVLADSGAATVVVDRPDQLEKVLSVRDELPHLRTVVAEEGTAPGVVSWEEWLRRGAGALAVGARREVDRRTELASPQDDALLIYTSGSTGEPKGARLSHRCVLASADSIRRALGLTETDSALSFLPFCHAAERVFGLYTRVLCGMEVCLVEDHARVWEAALAFGPTVFGGLPRFYEKVYEALRDEELRASGAERRRWARVLELGRERSRLRRRGVPVPARADAEWRALGEPVFARVRDRFGGRVRLATSGGAALPLEVAEYLDALGLTVLGAYGLTEHLCAAFNRPERYSFHTAGPPMPGAELRIAADGEILLRRGPLSFSGYHGLPEQTRQAFSADGEWLLSGDLGEIGPDGCLRVTGRKKELLALSTGKKVAPLPIESLLMGDPMIAQAVLIGEGRRYVSALLAPRRALVEGWARHRGLAMEYADLLHHAELRDRLQQTVDSVNRGLSRTERIRRFLLLEQELSAERDELTPTQKIRRPVVEERYREQLDALYLLPEP